MLSGQAAGSAAAHKVEQPIAKAADSSMVEDLILLPLNHRECVPVVAHAVTNGIPSYCSRLDDALSAPLVENLDSLDVLAEVNCRMLAGGASLRILSVHERSDGCSWKNGEISFGDFLAFTPRISGWCADSLYDELDAFGIALAVYVADSVVGLRERLAWLGLEYMDHGIPSRIPSFTKSFYDSKSVELAMLRIAIGCHDQPRLCRILDHQTTPRPYIGRRGCCASLSKGTATRIST